MLYHCKLWMIHKLIQIDIITQPSICSTTIKLMFLMYLEKPHQNAHQQWIWLQIMSNSQLTNYALGCCLLKDITTIQNITWVCMFTNISNCSFQIWQYLSNWSFKTHYTVLWLLWSIWTEKLLCYHTNV